MRRLEIYYLHWYLLWENGQIELRKGVEDLVDQQLDVGYTHSRLKEVL